ncbi:DNA alkylation repair protein [Saccharicrinis fermentans]|uniref:DNA alkylation repair enzyme n=1 Tax=Saccharicrinis fermentans DSM 9555 = JCM 21142 TaxID=869213 RepID=W7YDM6_9BACT|nr:DNA alkylation repair protein [Saccharicrinis fermentans]GAF02576.1 DNA alkylation repair enzyme [Saccharicrinis fermentans DSM 9555 = JCM 21142]
MDFKDIYTELEKCGAEENRKVFRRHGAKGELFGVSFADMRKLKDEVVAPDGRKGVNHHIARELWNTRNIDARILACMIADPKIITHNEANRWVANVRYYVLADYFAELIARSSFGLDIMYLWIQSPDEYIKRVGFSILNYFAKNDQSKSDLFFTGFIQKIKNELQTSPNRAKEGMNTCLISIGGRTEALREKVLQAASVIGPVDIDHGEATCKTLVIEEYVNKVWARK